ATCGIAGPGYRAPKEGRSSGLRTLSYRLSGIGLLIRGPLKPHRLSVMHMRIALYQPDIPQNAGTILRLAACLGVEAHIIGPAGFPTSDRAFRRAGMDYLDHVDIVRHDRWLAFESWRKEVGGALVLFTTHAKTSYLDRDYQRDDLLLFGRESA